MDIHLAYDKDGLVIHLPDQYNLTVIEPSFVPGLADPSRALQQALRSPRNAIPLNGFASPGDSGGQRTVLGNHDAKMIANPGATWGTTHGNPIWEEVQEAARMAGKTFLVNVTLNKHKQITGVFAGELDEAHAAGCAFAKSSAMVLVGQPFDIVITTNSGYPLDLNLYQAVKGMSAAAQIVKPGGAIIVAAECWDGIPEHGLYSRLLRQAKDPQDLLDTICTPGFNEQDQWEAQIQAQIQLKADVYVYSDYLTDEQICTALLKPCRSIEKTVSELVEKYGPAARICILPEGPQIIPYIQS